MRRSRTEPLSCGASASQDQPQTENCGGWPRSAGIASPAPPPAVRSLKTRQCSQNEAQSKGARPKNPANRQKKIPLFAAGAEQSGCDGRRPRLVNRPPFMGAPSQPEQPRMRGRISFQKLCRGCRRFGAELLAETIHLAEEADETSHANPSVFDRRGYGANARRTRADFQIGKACRDAFRPSCPTRQRTIDGDPGQIAASLPKVRARRIRLSDAQARSPNAPPTGGR